MNPDTTDSALQAILGALGLLLAATTIALNVRDELRPLGVMEKLTAIVTAMPQGPVRDLLTRERDDRGARWVLLRQAPQLHGLLFVALLSSGVALLLMGFWVWLVLTTASASGLWAVYTAALTIAVAGFLLSVTRRRRRDAWVAARRDELRMPTA